MEVIEERWRPNLGEDIRTSSRSRRMTVVFLAFLSPSNRDLSVSTSTSNYKQSRDQCENKGIHVQIFVQTNKHTKDTNN